jgi:hypothetical protein
MMERRTGRETLFYASRSEQKPIVLQSGRTFYPPFNSTIDTDKGCMEFNDELITYDEAKEIAAILKQQYE